MAVDLSLPDAPSLHYYAGPAVAPTGASLDNDNFADATPIIKTLATWNSPTVDVSIYGTQPGEPGPSVAHSVWWSYTPDASGTAIISIPFTDGNWFIHVYTGDTLATLVSVEQYLGDAGTFTVNAGVTYSLKLGYYGADTDRTPLAFSLDGPAGVAPATSLAPVNDRYADPVELTVAHTGDIVYPPTVLNTFATRETGEQDGTHGRYAYRTVWYSYRPAVAGTFSCDVYASSVPASQLYLHIFRDVDGTIGNAQLVAEGSATLGYNVTAGTLYLIRVGSVADATNITYALAAAGPYTSTSGPLGVTGALTIEQDVTGTLAVAQALDGTVTGEHDVFGTLIADAASIVALTGTSTVDSDVTGALDTKNLLTGTVTVDSQLTGTLTFKPYNIVPPVAVGVGVAYPPTLIKATIALQTPIDQAIVPSKRPTFTATVDTYERTATLEIQISATADFAAPQILTAPIVFGTAVIRVAAQATTSLADDGSYYWRARAKNAFDATDWTAVRTFTVSILDGDAVCAGGWTVKRGATVAAPHIWYTIPDRAKLGDPVVVYGTGFSSNPSVTVAGVLAIGPGTADVPPATDAYTDDRKISIDGSVSPYHQTISLSVPDGVEAPGGILYVDSGN